MFKDIFHIYCKWINLKRKKNPCLNMVNCFLTLYIQSIKYIPQSKYGTYPTSLPPELRTDTVCTNLLPRSGGKEHPDVGHASVLQLSNRRVTGTQSRHTNTGSFAKMVHNLPLIPILFSSDLIVCSCWHSSQFGKLMSL